MDITLIDYEELASKAREEVTGLNAPATTVQTLNLLIDSFIDIQERQKEMNWDHRWVGFSLKIPSISADLYNSFERIASKVRKSPGRVLSYLMELVIQRDGVEISASDLSGFMNQPSVQIQHIKHLTITKQDLQELDENEKVGIQHIRKLTIDQDIDAELFLSKIAFIQHCKEVILPKGYSPLMVMSKSQFCKNYGFQ